MAHLRTYRWSSYLDYIGKENFPSIITTGLFGKAFGDYEKAIARYLKAAEPGVDARTALE